MKLARIYPVPLFAQYDQLCLLVDKWRTGKLVNSYASVDALHDLPFKLKTCVAVLTNVLKCARYIQTFYMQHLLPRLQYIYFSQLDFQLILPTSYVNIFGYT
jgi:hypothetical protein